VTASTATLGGRRLRRVQLGARAALTLGIGASLAANVLAADPSTIGRLIAAWPPVALLVTVELWDRVPTSSGARSRLRIVAAAAIAAIAAWVSYWHMVEVALAFGEAPVAAHLLPFSVDGLVIVASVALVELNTRQVVPTPTPDTGPAAAAAPDGRRLNGSTVPRPATKAKAPRRGVSTSVTTVGLDVRRVAGEHPDWTQAQVAEAVGCSVRTVRRHLTATPTPTPTLGPGSNGSDPLAGKAVSA